MAQGEYHMTLLLMYPDPQALESWEKNGQGVVAVARRLSGDM